MNNKVKENKMDNRKIAISLVRLAKKLEAEEGEYQEFFKKKLESYGVNSPAELDDAKKKKFFSEIENEWTKEKSALADELEKIAKELEGAEGDKCGEKGCIRRVGDNWRVMSGKTGKLWPAKYPTEDSADNALKAWHGSHFQKT